MAVYQSYKEKKMVAKYADIDSDYIPSTIQDWAALMQYNPKAYKIARSKENEIKAEKHRVEKLIASTEAGIVNLAIGVKNPTHWFPCERTDLGDPSAAEQLIIDQLNRYNIVWYREVSFYGLKFTDLGYARYDILIQVPGNIHIIEYDGELWHNKPEQIAKDNMKTLFCKQHNIPLTRYTKKHYYHIERHIKELMAEYNIRKR